MADKFVDPYLYPGENVLRNELDIHDNAELEAIEYQLTWARRKELEQESLPVRFDFDYLCHIHFVLFQDIYSWAGQPRTVAITKGSSVFYRGESFSEPADYTFSKLYKGSLLNQSNASEDQIVTDLAELLSDLNYMHPFREGNGRTQRVFLDRVMSVQGRVLSWRNITSLENKQASIRAIDSGDGKPFEPMVREVLKPPLDGLSPFENDIYTAIGPLAA
jgi:cell filamentation protein